MSHFGDCGYLLYSSLWHHTTDTLFSKCALAYLTKFLLFSEPPRVNISNSLQSIGLAQILLGSQTVSVWYLSCRWGRSNS
jgi:hypothetical protein